MWEQQGTLAMFSFSCAMAYLLLFSPADVFSGQLLKGMDGAANLIVVLQGVQVRRLSPAVLSAAFVQTRATTSSRSVLPVDVIDSSFHRG
jgi:hypothetical protein